MRSTRFRQPTVRRCAVATIVAAALMLTSCGSGEAPSASPATSAAGLGAEVYATSCASCHGVDLRGTEKGPSPLSIVYEPNHHGDDAFRAAITNGAPQHHWSFGEMKPVEGLAADDIEAVIAYIRDEQRRLGFEQS